MEPHDGNGCYPILFGQKLAQARWRKGNHAAPNSHFVLQGKMVKSCSKCCSPKPLEEFRKSEKAGDGYASACMKCGGR